jgi:hypothetical protein
MLCVLYVFVINNHAAELEPLVPHPRKRVLGYQIFNTNEF